MTRGVARVLMLLAVPIALGAPPAGAGVELLPSGTFQIIPGDSSAVFMVPDNRGGFTGRTAQITGRITVESSAEENTYVAQVAASIDTPSLTTGNGLRDAAMRTIYLKTAEYPTMSFAGAVTAHPGLGVQPFPASVRGTLTIRDVTRDVEFTATVVALAHEYLADASATVRMADYQIPYPRAFVFVAHDPVTVTLHIHARQG